MAKFVFGLISNFVDCRFRKLVWFSELKRKLCYFSWVSEVTLPQVLPFPQHSKLFLISGLWGRKALPFYFTEIPPVSYQQKKKKLGEVSETDGTEIPCEWIRTIEGKRRKKKWIHRTESRTLAVFTCKAAARSSASTDSRHEK